MYRTLHILSAVQIVIQRFYERTNFQVYAYSDENFIEDVT